MNDHCICDFSSDAYSEDKKEDGVESDRIVSNRIFLNFTREYRNPAKDRYNQEKVKELFKHLRERLDLQEIKVSGRPDNREKAKVFGGGKGKRASADDEVEIKEEDDVDDDNNNNNIDDDGEEDDVDGDEDNDNYTKNGWYSDEGSARRCGGQRFTMSRDFWYRKLNTLKAQKLDEAALEAEDMPRDDRFKIPKCIRFIRNEKIYADQVPQKKEEMFLEMAKFEENVARPVERCLRKNFVNVYDNREYFRNDPE